MTTMSARDAATAAALEPMEGVWRKLLAEHVEDGHGRCAACRWQTRAADRWPCNIHLLAAGAQRLARERAARSVT